MLDRIIRARGERAHHRAAVRPDRLSPLMIALAAPLAAMGCAGDADPEAIAPVCTPVIEGDLYIGGLLPYTGVWPAGEGLERGAAMAVREVNESGGIHGSVLGLMACDSQGRPDVGTELMHQFAS